jgi:manganese transport protein
MKKIFGVTLGILTAMGGFVDIGDIVANSATGARFGMSLAWAVVLGVVGIVVFAEMSGRVASVSKRAVFDVVRERLGARVGMVNLAASFFITMLTLIAEVAGVALSVQLVTDVNYLLWIPLAGVLVWLVIWRVKFTSMETVFGLMGLALIAVTVAVVQLHPSWSGLFDQASHPTVPSGEGTPTYFYYAIALFGAAMTPYEVFFFSSGAVEPEPRQRVPRVPAGRAAVALVDGGFGDRVLPSERRGGHALTGRTAHHAGDREAGPRGGDPGFRRLHLRRRARDRALVRLHDVAVLRLAMGQARAPA